ncbi:MAG: hypothetical protein SFZ23_04350 [Planctomycetota bacterium]|nr:hypothetical protein [Planctomycetota bacterium]
MLSAVSLAFAGCLAGCQSSLWVINTGDQDLELSSTKNGVDQTFTLKPGHALELDSTSIALPNMRIELRE